MAQDQKTKNPKLLKRLVEGSSNIRFEIDGLWKEMSFVGKLFDVLFNIERRTFGTIHRAHYYDKDTEGEYARLYRNVQNFATIARYLKAIGIDERFNEFLEEFGIKVEVIKPVNIRLNILPIKLKRKVDHQLHALLGDSISEDPKELIKQLLGVCSGLQAQICDMADQINLSDAEIAKMECGVEKPHYKRAVRIKTDFKKAKSEERGNKSLTQKVVRAKQSAESIVDSVSIF